MNKRKIIFLILFFFCFIDLLEAKYIDLGTHGKTYKIVEPDFMKELKSAVKKYFSNNFSIEKIREQIKKEVYQQSIGKTNLSFAKKNKKYSYLNSYTFQQNIINPMGRIIFHRGETIVINNKKPFYLCFLKGNIPELKNEVAFFDKIMKKISPYEKCTYLIAGISVFKLSKIVPNHDFYPVKSFYEKRFKVKHYPSLVELKGKYINVYEFGIEQFKHKE